MEVELKFDIILPFMDLDLVYSNISKNISWQEVPSGRIVVSTSRSSWCSEIEILTSPR